MLTSRGWPSDKASWRLVRCSYRVSRGGSVGGRERLLGLRELLFQGGLFAADALCLLSDLSPGLDEHRGGLIARGLHDRFRLRLGRLPLPAELRLLRRYGGGPGVELLLARPDLLFERHLPGVE